MTTAAKMTNHEIRTELSGLRYKMEYSVHRRHDAPELYAADLKRFHELDDEYARR